MSNENENLEVKNHYIKTIQDFVDVVTIENFDNFLIDFKMFLVEVIKAKAITKMAIEIAGSTEDDRILVEQFHWIEDGKHDNHGVTMESTDGSVRLDLTEIFEKMNHIDIPENKNNTQ